MESNPAYVRDLLATARDCATLYDTAKSVSMRNLAADRVVRAFQALDRAGVIPGGAVPPPVTVVEL